MRAPDRCCGKRISERPSTAVRSAIAWVIGSTCRSWPGSRCSCSRSTNEFYPSRSTVAGSSRPARLAGTHAASTPTAASTAAAGQAEGQPRRDEDANAAEDKAHDARRLRAERDAQADLRPTRAHRVRDGAVEAESGQQERERTEEPGHHRN